jgi:hypothetical protein
MDRRTFLKLSGACALALGEEFAMTPAEASPASAKQAGLTVTAAERANAVRNAARFPWAAAEREAAVRAAEPWRLRSDEALWDLVPGQELPRSIHVFKVSNSNKIALCPHCKDGIVPFGNYPWITDVFTRTWKIECPNCHAIYPKNDFGAYYRSARDVHGFFRRDKGDARLLFNAEHPDPTDPLHTYGVDAGYGWQEPGGERWDFIAVYTQWGLWPQIRAGIAALAGAYTVTNETEYAHKCGVLLARLADVYPDMDWHPLYEQGFSHSDGLSGYGRVEGCIWECGNGTVWALAYDQVFDGLKSDPDLARFVGAKHRQENLTPIDDPRRLCAHIEKGLIEEIVVGVKDGRLAGNQGMHQTTMIAAAFALDRPDETPGLIAWTFAPGRRTNSPDTPGRRKVTGGDLAHVLVGLMDRDGLGDEGAPGYSESWAANLQQVADLLEIDPRYRRYSLYRNYPKFRRFFYLSERWTCLDAVTPPIGDSGSTGAWGVLGRRPATLLRAFRVYRDPELARSAWKAAGEKRENVHGSIFETDPEALQRAVAACVQKPDPPLESRLMDGFGLAILQTPHPENGRALWLYYGRNTGHGHLDRLNLGLYAENIDMLPDLGYPEYASGRPRDLAWTRNNAAHNVPIVDGQAQQPSYTGHVRAFEPEGRVRLVDVASDGIYADAATTRRTACLVDVDDRNSYVVDIVRVRGGAEHTLGWHGPSDQVTTTGLALQKQEQGTFAGPDVALEALAPDWNDRAGYAFLYNVERDDRPPLSFTMDYRGEDLRGRIAPGREPHLRLHNLTALQEAALADGDPPQNRKGVPRRLRYLLLTRRGRALESVFVTVLEPYDREPFLRSVRLVPAQSDTPGVHPVVVEVVTKDGRTDLLIAAESAGRVTAEAVRFEGRYGFLARRDDKVEIAKLMSGTRLEHGAFALTASTAAFTGVLKEVLPDNPDDQRLHLSEALPVASRRAGRLLMVTNDAVQDAAYMVDRWVGASVASLGGISLVRGLKDRNDPAQGLVYNVRPGDRYEVPTFVYLEHPGAANELRQANVAFRLKQGP